MFKIIKKKYWVIGGLYKLDRIGTIEVVHTEG